jgi:hypothetical protein
MVASTRDRQSDITYAEFIWKDRGTLLQMFFDYLHTSEIISIAAHRATCR